MKKLKVILAVLLIVLVIVLVVQNTEEVQTKVLFMTIEMPRAALLLITFLAGTVVGLLLATRLGKSEPAAAEE